MTQSAAAEPRLAGSVIARGREVSAANLWVSGRRVARAVFGPMGKGISPYPYAFIFPQDEHERLLIDRVSDAGVRVERELNSSDSRNATIASSRGSSAQAAASTSAKPRSSPAATAFSTYHVHHRVADRFRSRRAFLLGDAAHVHSPVGGQGMNTGIGDAVNLAWKLAAVLRERAGISILDTYEPERIAFAQRLVATTDQAFTGVSSSSVTARTLRLHLVPALLPRLLTMQAVRRLAFRTVSQTAINYRGSALSEGRAGRVRGGDRLPWVPLDTSDHGADNFTPLMSLERQVHIYGDAVPEIRAVCAERHLALHEFGWQPAMERAGLRRDALYLLRPDGYVALAAFVFLKTSRSAVPRLTHCTVHLRPHPSAIDDRSRRAHHV